MEKSQKSQEKNDLGVKIGTKEEALWTQTLKEAKGLLEQSERNKVIQQGMIELCERKIAEEKEKFKK